MNKAEEITGISLSQWEVIQPDDPSQYFEGDAVIEAYFKGKADGISQTEKLSLKQFSDNFNFAKENIIRVLNELEKNEFDPLAAYLKVKSVFSFKVIIVVKEEDFIKQSFLSNYEFLTNFEQEIQTDFFTLKFSFLDGIPDDLDEALMSDGYQIKFSPIDEASTRQA
ncbi:MAG TPA: hypothetical protein VIM55_13115 [Mucilaginibacter sp.]